ncbi:MAG TPA: sensor domain-containing diguanylate cyclase [Candidatus Polarisedimenticolia bacterium]|jgi:diguanylate cyclase (GGDEF)-like protein
MPGEAIWFLLVGGLLCAVGALGGILAERRRLSFVIREQAARNSDLRRRCADIEQIYDKVDIDNKELSAFLVLLPDVVRRLNSHMSKRSIPPLLASTLDQIFEPAQIAIYTRRTKDELVLSHGKGLPDGLNRGQIVKLGHGRIGLAARHQMTMDRDDAQSDTLTRHNQFDPGDPPGIPIDLIAPMVHEGETLGVVCIGGITRPQRAGKKMIKLVADLGSLALNNNDLFTRLESIANADSLTNLCTKRFLNIRLGTLTVQAEQTHTPLTLIIFDIDHFKLYNDTYGHLAGDEILKTVASIFKAQLRNDDIAARYGGEEFVVVLPNTNKEDAVRIAEKIRSAIERHPFPAGNGPGKPGSVTISGGVASHLVDGKSSSEILSAADQALYLAKERGRNRIVEFRSRYLSDDEDEELTASI